MDVRMGPWHRLTHALSIKALELGSIAFLISFFESATHRRRRYMLAVGLGLSVVAYTNATIWAITTPGVYYGFGAIAILGTMLLVWYFFGKRTSYIAGVFAGCLGLAYVVIWVIGHDKPELGDDWILAALNFIVGAQYWRAFRRWTAGVLTTVFGFFAWGAMFPLGMLDAFAPSPQMEFKIWDMPMYLVAVGMILTLLEDQLRKDEYLAYHDWLTGLLNRRLLEDRLQQALARADREGTKIAVLLIDLDRFKEINDTFGHRTGDLALQQVAMRLAGRIRASDTLARSGGDEFTVVSHIANIHDAEVLALALESALVAPLEVEGQLIHTGLSIGVALYPDQGRNRDELCAAADRAMYAAKHGRQVGAIPSSEADDLRDYPD
jgi:diguanylate cyclase (GGDEF)-like protein